MQNVGDTIISQYATAPTLTELIGDFNTWIDPAADINNFYAWAWDLDTAVGVGLDIWGKVVGVSRVLQVTPPSSSQLFGFKEEGGQPFGQGPFYIPNAATNAYSLSDAAFRKLILVKALANITNCTIPSYSKLLNILFAGRGRCYVLDMGAMRIQYVFEFYLLPYEISILTKSGALPRPAGVAASIVQADPGSTFGFKEAGVFQPFGYGVFNPGVLPAA